MSDLWRIELGPDDTRIRVYKNGIGFMQIPVAGTLLSTMERALDFVKRWATHGDELVLHISGVL